MKPQIRPLSIDDSDAVRKKLKSMFAHMYDFMENKDLVLSLADNGETIWLDSITSSLGKLNMVFIAIVDDEIVGFIAGNIKLGPAFLGSKKIGYISHTYVVPDYRKSDVGHLLLEELEKWFYENNVDHVEGEVLYQNEAALEFFKGVGYSIDNIRIFKNNENS